MVWSIELASTALKELKKLDSTVQDRIIRFLKERVAKDPRSTGEPLRENLSGFWRYRIGDYRVYADIQDEVIKVLVVKIGHRREVYKAK